MKDETKVEGTYRYLFLDDVRDPKHCAAYMRRREPTILDIYAHAKWDVVRDYAQFVDYIKTNGLPDLISFDHDLSDDHYHEAMYKSVDEYEKAISGSSAQTGNDCAVFLVNYCMERNQKMPYCAIHSMNPVGCERIAWTLDQFAKMGGDVNTED